MTFIKPTPRAYVRETFVFMIEQTSCQSEETYSPRIDSNLEVILKVRTTENFYNGNGVLDFFFFFLAVV